MSAHTTTTFQIDDDVYRITTLGDNSGSGMGRICTCWKLERQLPYGSWATDMKAYTDNGASPYKAAKKLGVLLDLSLAELKLMGITVEDPVNHTRSENGDYIFEQASKMGVEGIDFPGPLRGVVIAHDGRVRSMTTSGTLEF